MTKTNRADSSKPASQSRRPVKFRADNSESAELAETWLGLREGIRSLMNPLIFAGTHIGQISWTNDGD
jgi:hypothetical protein